MTIGNKKDILSRKPVTEDIDLPGWSFKVRVAQFTVGRRVAFIEQLSENLEAVEAHKNDPENNPEVEELDEAILGLIYMVVDEDGELLFTLDDYGSIKELPYIDIQKIYITGQRLQDFSSLFEMVETKKKN